MLELSTAVEPVYPAATVVLVRDGAQGLEALLVQRNNAWMQIIEPMFRDDDTEFVLVGAAHLVGEDGLLSQLQAKGYTITQLP